MLWKAYYRGVCVAAGTWEQMLANAARSGYAVHFEGCVYGQGKMANAECPVEMYDWLLI